VPTLWIGSSSARAAARLRVVAESIGVAVHVEPLPSPDRLDADLTSLTARYDEVVWLLADRDERPEVETADAMARGVRVEILAGHDDDPRWPLQTIARLFPDEDVARRRLLRVDDVFDVSERGALVAPEVDKDLLPGPGIQSFRVRLVRPDGTEVRTHAKASIPFVSATKLVVARGFVLMMEGLTRQDVPRGTQVFRDG